MTTRYSMLRKLREDKGLSQSQLARAVGISIGRLAHYERGRRELPVDIAQRIGKVLEIDRWLMYEEEEWKGL